MAQVIISNLIKTYPEAKGPGITAVKDISLTVADGEFMVLVGPSGCGKSTTLRMIAGLEDISGGTVAIDGRVVNAVEPKDRDIAMVFQNYALYPHMTVRENMSFGLRLRKFPAKEIDARVHAAADLLGLESLLDRRPKALSGGQRQRVAVGRAIVRQPKVFLFDEPLSNLDAKMRVSMRTEISKLHARLGATMIYVTHDQVEAMTMGDRICVMKDGEIQQVAEPLTLYNQPANLFVAGFIGSPQMNFLKGRLERTGTTLRFIETAPEKPVTLTLDSATGQRLGSRAGQPVVLGIRPEDLDEAVYGTAPQQCAELTIDLSEPLGSETYLYLRSAAHNLIARLSASARHAHGHQLLVSFHVPKAHFFDPVTEAAL
jgi:multiple sugar transport system ATP-binding protein